MRRTVLASAERGSLPSGLDVHGFCSARMPWYERSLHGRLRSILDWEDGEAVLAAAIATGDMSPIERRERAARVAAQVLAATW